MISNCYFDARRHQAPALTESRFVTFDTAECGVIVYASSDSMNIHKHATYRARVCVRKAQSHGESCTGKCTSDPMMVSLGSQANDILWKIKSRD